MDLTSDFWTGLFLGLSTGLMAGMLLKEGYDLLSDAWKERKKMKDEDGSGHSGDGAIRGWISRKTEKWSTIGIVLTMIAVYMVGLGTFEIIVFTEQSNFTDCQANYNQQTSVARKARLKAADKENNSFYAWLDTLPPLLARKPGEPPDPATLEAFNTTLALAIQAHKDNIQAQKDNPYPPEPETTCGEN